MKHITFAASVGLALMLTPSFAQATLNDCSAAKKKCVSKKTASILRCHIRDEKPPGISPLKFSECLQKAKDKFDGGADPSKGCFAKVEAKFPGGCLTTGDTTPLEAKVDAYVYDVVCQLDPGCSPRFVDNGDGTVTDHQTALTWEKKATWDASYVNCTSAVTCPDPHDADNTYTWANATSIFLGQLNGGGGFAGHTDWRLATLSELQTIIDYNDSTAPTVNVAFDMDCVPGSSCTNSSSPTCSCTVWGGASEGWYWSSTTYAPVGSFAWPVLFHNGSVNTFSKSTLYWVRAVRTGS